MMRCSLSGSPVARDIMALSCATDVHNLTLMEMFLTFPNGILTHIG